MILDLVVREVVERLQNRHFDDDDLVPRHASGRGLPFLLRLAPNRAQPRTEVLPGHDRVQDNQRILLGIETAIALAEVEETGLPHSCPLAMKPAGYPPSQSCARERSIFRGAHTPHRGRFDAEPDVRASPLQRPLPPHAGVQMPPIGRSVLPGERSTAQRPPPLLPPPPTRSRRPAQAALPPE